MMEDHALRRTVLAVIVTALTAAAVFGVVGWLIPGAVLAVLSAVLALELGVSTIQAKRRSKINQTFVEKAAEHAESGRKLVIYERETGLFAHWYIMLRCDEECYRARRYNHNLAVVVLEPARGNDEPWVAQDLLANWLRRQLRKADLASYVGNGSYVVLMPESTADVARAVVDRLRTEVEGIEVGLSSFPDDGQTFDELLSAARRHLSKPSEVRETAA